jgi:hypothetical protein
MSPIPVSSYRRQGYLPECVLVFIQRHFNGRGNLKMVRVANLHNLQIRRDWTNLVRPAKSLQPDRLVSNGHSTGRSQKPGLAVDSVIVRHWRKAWSVPVVFRHVQPLNRGSSAAGSAVRPSMLLASKAVAGILHREFAGRDLVRTAKNSMASPATSAARRLQLGLRC